MGTQVPQCQEVSGIMVYNVDVQNKQSIRYITSQLDKPKYQNVQQVEEPY